MKMIKLKRCPLCGGEATFDAVESNTNMSAKSTPEITYTASVICCNCYCGISGDGSKTEGQAMESAAKKWNTRKYSDMRISLDRLEENILNLVDPKINEMINKDFWKLFDVGDGDDDINIVLSRKGKQGRPKKENGT